MTTAAGRRALRALSWALAAATVLANICWVLAGGATRDALTAAGVLLFFGASLSHSVLRQGLGTTAIMFAVVLVFGWAIEAVGTASGLPFGAYDYADRLGPQLAGVPLVIPLAWAMMTYPCFLLSRAAVARRSGVIALAAALLATWDLFLDPQMVAEGHWRWSDPSPNLPGIPGIPLSNFVGWLLAATVLMTVLMTALTLVPRAGEPTPPRESLAQPMALLAWVYGSSVLANAVFLGRPSVALVGGVAMGIPMIILCRGLWPRAATTGPSASQPVAAPHA